MSKGADAWVQQIRNALRRGGSPEHAQGVQWFFKEEVRSHGWYTADLRRFARQTSREIQATGGLETLVQVADRLFTGEVLEEKNFAVLLLEKSVAKFGEREFRLCESWLNRVTSWADHDALVHYLIGPLIAAEPRRTARVFRWTKSRNRWRRRAAAVSLIRGARQRLFFAEIVRVSDALLQDQDDMVQKGLGWLLREAAKADPKTTVPYLLRIRDRAPRLVLRTACETLPRATRARVLSAARNQNPRVSSADGP
ncbi:MAG TPA: DNA alkylation repair protein [Terriglobales bacterium]|nr:DNA alkylation repair protein [Terriglobales bacterium]